MGALTVKAKRKTVDDAILATFAISPSVYPGTRLTQLSQLWEYYRFLRLSVRYVPAVPTTVGCQLVAYIDTDPVDDPLQAVSIVEAVRRAVAHASSKAFNIYAAQNIPLVQRADDTLYYCGSKPQELQRFTRQGKLHIVQITDPVNINTEPLSKDLRCGSLFLDWHIEFQVEQIGKIFSDQPVPPIPPVPPTPTAVSHYTWPSTVRDGVVTSDNFNAGKRHRYPGSAAWKEWQVIANGFLKTPTVSFIGVGKYHAMLAAHTLPIEGVILDVYYTNDVTLDVSDGSYTRLARIDHTGVKPVTYKVDHAGTTILDFMPNTINVSGDEMEEEDAGLICKVIEGKGVKDVFCDLRVVYWIDIFQGHVDGLIPDSFEFVGTLPQLDSAVDPDDDFVIIPAPEGPCGVRRWSFDGAVAVGKDRPEGGGPATFTLSVGGESGVIHVPPTRMQELVGMLGLRPSISQLECFAHKWPEDPPRG